jgi:hypothetical protein
MDVQLDNNYPTGGYPVTPAQMGFGASGKIIWADLPEINGYSLEWDYTNVKLLVYRNGAGNTNNQQVPNATDLSATPPVRLMLQGFGNG